MASTNILSLVEQFDDEIDDLEDALEPLIKCALSDTAPKFPILDKAKLYVLVAYAIESVIFSYLRVQNVDARNHLIFKELIRVKQYFDKIKLAETPVQKNPQQLDKNAAARFIKAGLAANEKIDFARAEQLAKERARALIMSGNLSRKRSMEPVKESESDKGHLDSSDSIGETSSKGNEGAMQDIDQTKKNKKRKTEHFPDQSLGDGFLSKNHGSLAEASTEEVKKKKKKKKNQNQKGKKDETNSKKSLVNDDITR